MLLYYFIRKNKTLQNIQEEFQFLVRFFEKEIFEMFIESKTTKFYNYRLNLP